MISVAQRARGLLALVALLALVFAVPWALWTVGGAPWPSEAPTLDWLTQELGATQIMSVLAVVLWLAWAHFCVCVVVEALAARRSGRRSRVPGAGMGTQTLARRLVASVLLIAGTASIATPMATAVDNGRGQTTSVTAVATSVDVGVSGGNADMRSGAPRAEDAQGHSGKAEAETIQATKASLLTERGKTYVVRPPTGHRYDHLSWIAQRLLGDASRWPEIYELNKGIVQDDGVALRDPDLIYPDWVLALPDDARGPGVINVADRGTDGGRDVRNAVNRDGDKERDLPPVGEQDDATTQVAAGGGVGGTGVDLAAPIGVAGGLVAAGLLFALKRRRGWNGGGPRGGGGLKPEDEVGLRLAADSIGAALVDRALRQAAHSSAQAGATLGAIRAAYLDEQQFSIAFAAGSAAPLPPGWRASPDGRMWTVERSVAAEFDPPVGVASPCPGLVTLGAGVQGSLVLLDLSSAPGVTSLSGPQTAATEIALSIAVELGTNTWSHDARVCVVGLDGESAHALALIAPTRLRQAADVESFLADLEHGEDRPTTAIVLGSPDPEAAARLAALTVDPDRPVRVLVAGDCPGATWRLDVAAHGKLVNPLLGLDVSAQRLRPELLTTVAALFGAADQQRTNANMDLFLSSVPGFDPRLLDAAAAAPVSVQLLGPVQVEAPGPLDDERRDLCTEVVTYVALNPAGVHPSVLASAVWPGGVTPEVFSAAMGHVQRWLGTSATGQPRIASDGEGRWRLDLREVRVDWHVLQTRYERAQQSAQGSAQSSAEPLMDLAAGLSCVEGPPMEGLPARRYSWLAHSTLTRDMQVLVVRAAGELGREAVRVDNVELAHEALRTGLDMVPGCEELWRDELRLTHEYEPEQLSERVREMYAAIGAHGSPRGAEATTVALVEELLPGGRPVAVAQSA